MSSQLIFADGKIMPCSEKSTSSDIMVYTDDPINTINQWLPSFMKKDNLYNFVLNAKEYSKYTFNGVMFNRVPGDMQLVHFTLIPAMSSVEENLNALVAQKDSQISQLQQEKNSLSNEKATLEAQINNLNLQLENASSASLTEEQQDKINGYDYMFPEG